MFEALPGHRGDSAWRREFGLPLAGHDFGILKPREGHGGWKLGCYTLSLPVIPEIMESDRVSSLKVAK